MADGIKSEVMKTRCSAVCVLRFVKIALLN